jgi:hypothetical protein
MKDVGIFYGHLEYFTAIWSSLWPIGIFYGYFGYFFPVLACCAKRNLAILLLGHFALRPD